MGTPNEVAAMKFASESTNADAVASWFILNSFTWSRFEVMDVYHVFLIFQLCLVSFQEWGRSTKNTGRHSEQPRISRSADLLADL